MIGSIPLRSLPSSSSSSLFLEPVDLRRGGSVTVGASPVVCNAQRAASSIPKLEPFSRSKIDRRLKEPSFIQKSEKVLRDYCCILEGDESYSCWRAYFELKDLERDLSKEDVEKFLRQAGGVKTMIDCLHGLTAMQLRDKNKMGHKKIAPVAEEQCKTHSHIPDGLPKTREELEEEERARMPDSPFTRLLRNKGKHPAWYSQAPDHETD